jgi:REP element-mobilizing transposase RayT
MKIVGGEVHYHIVSRTVGREFFLGDVEKEYLLSLIRRYSNLFFVRCIGYCIMSNHFHIIAKTEPYTNFSEEEVARRVKNFRKTVIATEEQYQNVRARLEDISEYVRFIKQGFSRWYNRTNNRSGYFWGDRFKSVLLEPGQGLLACLAYIELNPIRAGMVKRPEQYRWCSFSERLGKRRDESFLSFDGIYDQKTMPRKTMLSHYRQYVYECGGVDSGGGKKAIDKEIIEKQRAAGYEVPAPEIMRLRRRYFTDGLALGSKVFIREVYGTFGDILIRKKDRKPHVTDISTNITSIRRLALVPT